MKIFSRITIENLGLPGTDRFWQVSATEKQSREGNKPNTVILIRNLSQKQAEYMRDQIIAILEGVV